MRSTSTAAALAVGVLLASSQLAGAQDKEDRKGEIGVGLAGFSVISQGDDTTTVVGVPNGGLFSTPAVYGSFFVTPKLALEPQLGLLYLSGGEGSAHSATLTGQANYFFKGRQTPSPYLLGRGSLVNAGGGGDSETRFSFGAGLGYRVPVGDRAVLRFEGRFDRRLAKDFDPAVNTIGAAIHLGITL